MLFRQFNFSSFDALITETSTYATSVEFLGSMKDIYFEMYFEYVRQYEATA